MKQEQLAMLRADLFAGEYGANATRNLTTLLREREQLLQALRALRAAHADGDMHCEACPKIMDEAIAAAESWE